MGLCMLYVFGLYGWMCGIAWDGIHRMRIWVYFVESLGLAVLSISLFILPDARMRRREREVSLSNRSNRTLITP